MAEPYWTFWIEHQQTFTREVEPKVDEACARFLMDRRNWSVIKRRWDNADWLLSGLVRDGIWGNIHILFFPETFKLRFTCAVWRDEDMGKTDNHRAFKRRWSTSDDNDGDRFLDAERVKAESVRDMISYVSKQVLVLATNAKFHENVIEVAL